MEHNPLAGKGNLLLLQHQPLIGPLLRQAAMPLGCKISIANDSRQFFSQYHESLLNPFSIFGSLPFDGIILDLVNAFQKSLEVLRELREWFPGPPPIIGLCPPSIVCHPEVLKGKGIDTLFAFPAREKTLQEQLRDFLLKSGVARQAHKLDLQKGKSEDLPVVNLKTLGLFRELAVMQSFPLEELLQSFFDEMGSFISRLIGLYERGNIEECERLIISIRSLGGTLGASQLAQTARLMEFSIKAGEGEKIGQWLPYLIEEFLTLRELLEGALPASEKIPLLN